MIQKLIFILRCAYLCFMFILITFTGYAKQDSPKNQKTREYVHVQAKTLQLSRIAQKVKVGARVISSAIVNIPSQTAGVITNIRVQEGDRVRKGMVILYVDASKSGKRYRPSPVIAPISGIVSNLSVKVGNKVSVGKTAATVVGTDDYKVEASVPEPYAHLLSVQTRGILQLRSFPEKNLPLIVSEISPKINKSTGSVDITLFFDGAVQKNKIISGMYGILDLMLEVYENQIVIERHTMVVRRNAHNKMIPGVFRVDEPTKSKSTVSFVPITIGIEESNKLQVLKGLTLDDVIVSIGQTHLWHKETVVVQELDGVMRDIPASIYSVSENE